MYKLIYLTYFIVDNNTNELKLKKETLQKRYTTNLKFKFPNFPTNFTYFTSTKTIHQNV